jgi:hypothetical protein
VTDGFVLKSAISKWRIDTFKSSGELIDDLSITKSLNAAIDASLTRDARSAPV